MNEEQEPMSQLSAHLDRGWDLVARGDFGRAMLSAEKSLELDEESPEAHNLLGYIFQAEGRADEALDRYRAALDLDEGYVDAMLNAADVLIHPLGDHEGALAMVREALEWLQEDEVDERTDALLLEIDIHLHIGDREAARKIVADLPDGPFETPGMTLQVGRAHLDVGDVDGAEPLLERAIEQGPPTGDAHYYMALVREARQDPTGALLSFLRTRELDALTPPPPWALAPEQFERRVHASLSQLTPAFAKGIEGALVVVTDLPGAEIVADGLDPRMPVLLDAMGGPDEGAPPVGRIFIYRRNVERVAAGLLEVEAEVVRALETELAAAFPELDATADTAPDAADATGDDGSQAP